MILDDFKVYLTLVEDQMTSETTSLWNTEFDNESHSL